MASSAMAAAGTSSSTAPSTSNKRSLGASSSSHQDDDVPATGAAAMRGGPGSGPAVLGGAGGASGGSKTRFGQLGGYRRSGKRWPQGGTTATTGPSTPSTTALHAANVHPVAVNVAAPGEVLLSPTTWSQTLSKMGPSSPPTRIPRSAMPSGMQPRSAGKAAGKRPTTVHEQDPFRTPSVSSSGTSARLSLDGPDLLLLPSSSSNNDSPSSPFADPMAVLQEQAGGRAQAPLFGDEPASRALRHRSSCSSVASSSARLSISSGRPSSAILSPVPNGDPLRSSAFTSPSHLATPPSPTLTTHRTDDRPALRDPFVTDLTWPLPASIPPPPSPTSPLRSSALPSSSSSPWSLDGPTPSSPVVVVEARRPSAPQLLRGGDEDPSFATTTTTTTTTGAGQGRQRGVRRVSQPLLPLGLGYRFGTSDGERVPRAREQAQREDMLEVWKAWAVESKRELEHGRRRSRPDDNLTDQSVLAQAASSRSSVDSFMTSSVGTSRGRAGSRTSSSRFPLLGPSHVHDSFVSLPPIAVVPLRPLPLALPASFPIAAAGGGGGGGGGGRPYNPFVPLRRRFALRPASDRPNVAVELLGELVEVLADYIAIYGRRVKVATAAMPPAPPTPAATSPSTPVLPPLDDHRAEGMAPSSQKDDRRLLVDSLCDELDALVAELVDVLPAFGTALTVGGYGPLALSRVGDRRSPGERFSAWAPRDSTSSAGEDGAAATTTTTTPMSTTTTTTTTTTTGAMGRWWAERLLRDLIEGLIGDDERSWAHYRDLGGGGKLTREEEVLTGALAALVEEDELGSEAGEGPGGVSQREKELLESGMRRWDAWKRSLTKH